MATNLIYPPQKILTQDRCRMVQLSDLHLPHDTDSAYHANFLAILNHALTLNPDLILLTGDLVQDGDKGGYDWLFDVLHKTGVVFVCIAGNHDVTFEHHAQLPFDKRSFSPVTPDSRLLDCHQLTLCLHDKPTWQLLLLNSAVGGEIVGAFNQESLIWLNDTLKNSSLPTLIALHHHPLPVASRWIDAYRLQNTDEFWQTLAPYPHVKAILCGHVHQAQALTAPTPYPCTLFTCPATSRQFLPLADSFAIDDIAGGFRCFDLYKEEFSTQVYRL